MVCQYRVLRIVAAVALHSRGATLLVRKRGTAAFMQPGGKLDPGETPLEALEREIREELGCGIERGSCRSLGNFRVAAANEPGFLVEAELFAVELSGEIRAAGEIEEMIWIDPKAKPALILAPLTRQHALPLARALNAEVRNARP